MYLVGEYDQSYHCVIMLQGDGVVIRQLRYKIYTVVQTIYMVQVVTY